MLCNMERKARGLRPPGDEEGGMTMCKLVWIERPLGLKIIKSKEFPDREARFKFIMFLEKQPAFDKVIEMRG